MTVFHTAHLRSTPDAVELYKARLLKHARNSLEREKGGCLRFDVHQDKQDPTLFLLIEIYRDEAAFEAHRNSPHFQAYKQDTQDWVAERPGGTGRRSCDDREICRSLPRDCERVSRSESHEQTYDSSVPYDSEVRSEPWQ